MNLAFDRELRDPSRLIPRLACVSALVLCLPMSDAHGAEAEPLLPDLIGRAIDLADHDTVTNIIEGRAHLRLAQGAANVGLGPLHVYGVYPEEPDGTHAVYQRIFRADGSFFDREVGIFDTQGDRNRIHIEGWAIFRLREVLPGGGVGEIYAESTKTSFCLLDLRVHDRSLPGFAPIPRYLSCGNAAQGISVGWADVYSKVLPGQNLDITDLSDGVYWLEAVADPENRLLESNEDNNAARIQLIIENPLLIEADAFEPNDAPTEVDQRPLGTPYSPNLGPCGPTKVIEDLNIHAPGNDDLFRLYSNHTGGSADFVRIDFKDSLGNLGLALLKAGGDEVAVSDGETDWEVIPLEGLPEGWYYVRVFGRNDAVNLRYRLTVDPPANEAPSITVLSPPSGDVRRILSIDPYGVTWSAFDPEGDFTWVSVYLNEVPVLDGTEELVPSSLFTPGELGVAFIDSTGMPQGTYWVYCAITDGGSTTGQWSQGTLTFVELETHCKVIDEGDRDCNANGFVDDCEIGEGVRDDCNDNGVPDDCDVAEGTSADLNSNGVPDDCEVRFHRGDSNDDGELNVGDPIVLLNFLFTGGKRPGCMEASDVDNDGSINITDAISLLIYLFLGGSPPADPGPPDNPCAPDSDPPESPLWLGCDEYRSC